VQRGPQLCARRERRQVAIEHVAGAAYAGAHRMTVDAQPQRRRLRHGVLLQPGGEGRLELLACRGVVRAQCREQVGGCLVAVLKEERGSRVALGEQSRQVRAQAGLSAIDWVVVRNRMGAQRMVNKEKMERAIGNLSKRIGFRTAPGFNERVIFRELFPRGLTLLDLKDIGVKQLNISTIAARQELRDLIKALDLPGVTADF